MGGVASANQGLHDVSALFDRADAPHNVHPAQYLRDISKLANDSSA